MIFAVFDPSPLTVSINCSFFTFIAYNVDAGYRAEADQFIFSLYIKCPSKTGGLLQHEQLLVSGWRCTFHMVAHKGHPSSVEETVL